MYVRARSGKQILAPAAEKAKLESLLDRWANIFFPPFKYMYTILPPPPVLLHETLHSVSVAYKL